MSEKCSKESQILGANDRPLLESSQWLKIVHVLAYTRTFLWNFERKDAEKPLSVNNVPSDGIPDPPPQTLTIQTSPPTPVPPIPTATTLSERHFFAIHPSLLPCIEEPKGRPVCGGGYSDVWQCNVRFVTPEAWPTKVSHRTIVTSQAALV